jgi:hypothetical protein
VIGTPDGLLLVAHIRLYATAMLLAGATTAEPTSLVSKSQGIAGGGHTRFTIACFEIAENFVGVGNTRATATLLWLFSRTAIGHETER